jgi:hypothetical protein
MLLIALAFPLLLMGLLSLMDWIEAPLRSEAEGDKLPAFLEQAQPEEIETFVRDGLKTALERHWLRQRVAGLLSGR